MKTKKIEINGIPAILWGEETEHIIIAVHGNLSHKADVPIELLALAATNQMYQVLSFDLPEHGDRKLENTPCIVQNAVHELQFIMDYVISRWSHISLFAHSLGAYFSLLAYHNQPFAHAWFLSPVLDMRKIIENMMQWFQISEEQLQSEKEIDTPSGQTLYWDYYCYVKEHPIHEWQIPTKILCGSSDELCDYATTVTFCNQFSCELEVVQGGEHYFHKKEELAAYRAWLAKLL